MSWDTALAAMARHRRSMASLKRIEASKLLREARELEITAANLDKAKTDADS